MNRWYRSLYSTLLFSGLLASCYLPDGYTGGVPPANGGAAGANAGSSGTSGYAGATPDGCEQVAAAHCARLKEQCATADAARGAPGEARCKSRMISQCKVAQKLPGANLSESGLLVCAKKIKALDTGCEGQDAPLEACAIRGKLENNALCSAAFQCSGGVCLRGEGSCGVCATEGKEGAPCSENPAVCAMGLSCQDGKCTPKQKLGAICSKNGDCASNLTCVDSKCTKVPSTKEDSCEITSVCAESKGLFCDGGLCVETTQHKQGDECWMGTPEAKARCPVGSWCKPETPDAGICAWGVSAGEECTHDEECGHPMQCLDGACIFYGACGGSGGTGGSSGGAGGSQ